jgi:hypothetical protein
LPITLEFNGLGGAQYRGEIRLLAAIEDGCSTAIVAIRKDRFTSIVLKNSNFSLDHNLEDRWRPRWKIP